ncbi:hypothetical protein D6C78_00714 [Aureobasidium pullulans]|uniref:Uncharacterized protein n=1 Tax=Aureobasidium pullulans TaxID=5580 RepID=A0A4T0C5U5_AURPU|nr:hypothetical protein D6C78_00714 [Aureobasidium pullulans]
MSCTRYADQGKEVTEFIQTASNAASPDDADAMLRAAVLETLETMQGMADTGIVDKNFGKKALAMFEALETESDSSGSQSNDSDDDLSDKEVDEDEEDKGSNDGEGADGEDEPDVPVKPHTRRFPELALVETLVVADLAPFETFEPAWPDQLLTVFKSRGIKPEKMEGLQNLLLDVFSRSRAGGAATLAEQWRSSKQHIDAYTVATNAPATTDNPFPRFTKQMILCLKSKAAQGVAEVFNLVEHVGVVARLSKALKAMSNKESVAYKAYRSWHDQQGKRGGRRGSYPSIRNFIIRTAVNAVFGHQPGTSQATNLKLVNAMVRRADVLRGLELAFGAGAFVLLLGFDWKSRTEKAWDEATEAVLLSLSDDCPMLRRVCRLVERNVWTKVVKGEKLHGPKLNVEIWSERERLNKDLLTLLSYEGEEVNELEELEMGDAS